MVATLAAHSPKLNNFHDNSLSENDWHGELINRKGTVLCSKNAALAYYSVFLVLHLVVLLVAFNKVDVTNAGVLINFISKCDFVSLSPTNCIAS